MPAPRLCPHHAGARLRRRKPNRSDESGSQRMVRPMCATPATPHVCKSTTRPPPCVATDSISFQESGALKRHDKITFNAGKLLFNYGLPCDENQVHRPDNPVLVQAKGLPQQPPGAGTGDGASDFFAGDYAHASLFAQRFNPVQDQTPDRQAAALSACALEVPPVLQAPFARQPQGRGRGGAFKQSAEATC